MQKKLIALAIAGLASTAAFAQTNVTLYGVLDATFDAVKATSAPAGGANRTSFSRVNSNSSYVGLKGTEDLGDDLKAVFQFETGFNTDSGVYSGSGRDTFVGLVGGFGTVKLGNLTGPTRAIGTTFDLLPGRTGIGTFDALLGRTVTATGGTATLFDNRVANTLSYTTPTMDGLSATLNYDPSENKTNSAAGASQANGKAWELGLNYANAGWKLKYAYARMDSGVASNAAANTTKVLRSNRLGVGYTFEGGHMINGIWDRQQQDLTGAAGTSLDQVKTGYAIEALCKISAPGSLIASFTTTQDASGNYLATNADTGARMYTFGYLHTLSKRTMLKAVASKIRNDKNVAYDFSNSVGVQGAGTTAFGNGASVSGMSLGIRHNF